MAKRFPTWPQALTIFFASVALNLTFCFSAVTVTDDPNGSALLGGMLVLGTFTALLSAFFGFILIIIRALRGSKDGAAGG